MIRCGGAAAAAAEDESGGRGSGNTNMTKMTSCVIVPWLTMLYGRCVVLNNMQIVMILMDSNHVACRAGFVLLFPSLYVCSLSLWRFHSTDSAPLNGDCYATQANNPFGQNQMNQSHGMQATRQQSRMEDPCPGSDRILGECWCCSWKLAARTMQMKDFCYGAINAHQRGVF